MSYEEKGTWVYLVVSAAVYIAYLVLVLDRAVAPITDTPYQALLLWSILAAVITNMLVRVVVEVVKPSDSHKVDARDRDIERFSVLRSWWFVVAGAVAALLMALAEYPYFWIANAIYLCFVLQAVAGSAMKLVAYRRGF